MTREEALQVLIIKANKGAFVEDIINQIFDEHEKEIKKAYIDGSNSNNDLIQFYLKTIEGIYKIIEEISVAKDKTFCAKCSKELIEGNK